MNNLKELLMGCCLGAANIIPGISGGTFLLIFNIYERVFGILTCINKACLVQFMGVAGQWVRQRGQKGTTLAMIRFITKNDFLFLIKLSLGAGIAILSLSALMKYLLTHYLSLTYSLFFGLILVSILIPVRMFRHFHPYMLVFICLGAAITVMVTHQVNPYEKAKQKSALYQTRYESWLSRNGQAEKPEPGPGGPGLPSPAAEYLYAGFCGAVSISAMLLPGISGSLVLILMGTYYDVLSAISALPLFQVDAVIYLGCFGLGIVLGGLLFARLVSYVFKRYYDATMAFLMGLMVGSLWALWPFKKVAVLGHHYVKGNGVIILVENARAYTHINVLPPMDGHLAGACVLFVLGCGIMYGFLRAQDTGSASSSL